MIIQCRHGFFTFQETRVGQVADWMAMTGLLLVPWQGVYTFDDLSEAPSYSLPTLDLLGIPATEAFEGEPWAVFEANGIVYNFNTGLVVPIASVTQVVTIKQAGNRFISPGLILPGSITKDGEKVRDYMAWFSRDTLRYSYSQVTYV